MYLTWSPSKVWSPDQSESLQECHALFACSFISKLGIQGRIYSVCASGEGNWAIMGRPWGWWWDLNSTLLNKGSVFPSWERTTSATCRGANTKFYQVCIHLHPRTWLGRLFGDTNVNTWTLRPDTQEVVESGSWSIGEHCPTPSSSGSVFPQPQALRCTRGAKGVPALHLASRFPEYREDNENLSICAIYNSQDECPSTEAVVHIHSGILLSHKNEWNNVIYSNIDGPRDYYTKSDREKQISYDITYMWNLKNDTNGLIYKTETDSQT